MLRNDITLIINTCEKYSDLWDSHTTLLNMNWNDREIDTFLLTDSLSARKFDNITTFCAGDGLQLPDRIRVLLPYLNTDFVLMTLDDYFPIHKIDSTKIEKLVNLMKLEGIDYIRLFDDPRNRTRTQHDNLFRISLDENYDVNLYQGIWKIDFLKSTLKSNLNAWDFEVSLTKSAKEYGAVCYLSTGKEYEILDVVRKGKILRKAKKYLVKNNIYNGSRETMGFREEVFLFLKVNGKRYLPKQFAILVKKTLRKLGVEFFSDSV